MGRVVKPSELIPKRKKYKRSEGQTMRDFAADVGLGLVQASRLMRVLIEEGRVLRVNIIENNHSIPFYVTVKAQKEKYRKT